MTQACFACKKFIAAAHALHCIHVSKHIFHEDCVRSGSSRGDVAPLICPVCGDGPLSRVPRMGRAAVSLADEASASSPVPDSLRDAFTLLLEKISNIESRLDDLAAVKTQITALEGSHNRLKARVVALEAHSASERQLNVRKMLGVLEGSEVSPSLAGSRINVNERLTASAREIYGVARRAVGEGRLRRAWVRNGIVHVRRSQTTPPTMVRHFAHLSDILTGAPLRPVLSGRESSSALLRFPDGVAPPCISINGGPISSIPPSPLPSTSSSILPDQPMTGGANFPSDAPFRLYRVNCQSLLPHFSEFIEYFYSNQYDIIAMSETWLKPRVLDSLVSLRGYYLVRSDREGRGGGEVGFYVRDGIHTERMASSPSMYCAQPFFNM
ncbi:hypothetical protein ALC57_13377 [Trachymyrmex cornetzi]|uniref:RING-type domain-containing protein n=1 Tax=Trachymyrmex cornetzi TaxID=471704 RepID=A0A151IZA6_9HYME|nr:hypothetical protein ALC57_13377 [Trachymyrmex cornetzi]